MNKKQLDKMVKKTHFNTKISLILSSVCIIVLFITLLIVFTKPNLFRCDSEDKDIIMPCYSVDKWYGLGNGRCINKFIDYPNKGCKTGWKKIPNNEVVDLRIQEVKEYGTT